MIKLGRNIAVLLGVVLYVFSISGGALANTTRWQPVARTSWQIQLNGKINTQIDAEVFDIDLFDAPQSTIDLLHAQGKKVICYFSAGSYEDWRVDAPLFPVVALGSKMSGWDELWLDIRHTSVRTIMENRMDIAVSKNCDAVDPDNVDGYTNVTGFPLTSSDQLNYNKFLVQAAHARGLAIWLKNNVSQIADLVSDYDFAINEECYTYKECSGYSAFIVQNKPVFWIQYTGKFDATGMKWFCVDARVNGFSFLKKPHSLKASRQACPVY